MILLHRLTSFALAILAALGFAILIFAPEYTYISLGVFFVLIPLLLSRLLQWDVKRASFWVFFGTPLFFLLSSTFLFLFLEQTSHKVILGAVVTFGIWLYSENLFSFYHLPSSYQAYALEYLSLAIYIASAFFFTSGSYAMQLFLQLPSWVPALAVFWTVLFATIGVFWVSKVAQEISTIYAFFGALMMTEIYIVLASLPISFMSNAAIFSIFLYMFLGLSRGHVLDKLTSTVLKRYIITGFVFLIFILLSARWV